MDVVTLSKLPRADRVRLKNSSKVAQSLEDEWAWKTEQFAESLAREVVEKLSKSQSLNDLDFESLFCEHYFEVSIRSIRYAMSDKEPEDYLPPGTGRKLALPKAKIPKSLADLMKLYDAYRKGKFKPKRPAKQAAEIKKEYLKKVSSVWEKYSRGFRSGDSASQEEVIKQIQAAGKTTASRAKGIVRTETTTYYNKARKGYYDQSQDITHYLFLAIRDAGTSPWCTPNTINGKRGRSGLVYSKDDPLCTKECPSCHPGCRSEFLPLNRLNPAHLKFIQNNSIQRRNHTCFPLLKGWGTA